MKNIEFNIPTSWNELNEFQREQICFLIYQVQEIDDKFKQLLLKELFIDEVESKNNSYLNKLKNYAILLSEVKVSELYPHLDFIFKSMSLTKFLKNWEFKDEIFYGPGDRLVNLTIEEFSFTDQLYFNWRTKKSLIDLDRLVTVLYRPLKTDYKDDVRIDFSTGPNLTTRGNIIPQMPLEKKLSIGFAFQGSRELMISKFPTIFPKQKIGDSTMNKTTPKYQSFNKMINSMAMGDKLPLGNLHEIKKTNVFEFFSIAQEVIITARETSERLK